MRKTKVIAFANNKGGSGKTTTCSNIACAMAMDGKRVLMIDGRHAAQSHHLLFSTRRGRSAYAEKRKKYLRGRERGQGFVRFYRLYGI